MNRFEHIANTHVETPQPTHPEVASLDVEREEIKDQIFDQYMKRRVIEDFFDVLSEYIESEDVALMYESISKYTDEEIYAALSLPYELRARKFNEFKTKLADGVEPQQLVDELVAVSKKFGYGVGYHTSPVDIRPLPSGVWQINGTEKDHRDNDLVRAYYSSKYRHLFRKKNPKFVYVVRTEPTAHRTDGTWSRASTLSVITRIPFAEVVQYVEKEGNKIALEHAKKTTGE